MKQLKLNKELITGTSLLARQVRNSNSDYICEMVVEQYPHHKISFVEILGKENLIECHRYYLDKHYDYHGVIEVSLEQIEFILNNPEFSKSLL